MTEQLSLKVLNSVSFHRGKIRGFLIGYTKKGLFAQGNKNIFSILSFCTFIVPIKFKALM